MRSVVMHEVPGLALSYWLLHTSPCKCYGCSSGDECRTVWYTETGHAHHMRSSQTHTLIKNRE